jgi:hypothetical protein
LHKSQQQQQREKIQSDSYNQAPALSGTAAYLFVNDQKTIASRILYPVPTLHDDGELYIVVYVL